MNRPFSLYNYIPRFYRTSICRRLTRWRRSTASMFPYLLAAAEAIPCWIVLLAALFGSYLLILYAQSLYVPLSDSSPREGFLRYDDLYDPVSSQVRLEKTLGAAATEDKTVILTTLNEAWAVPDSVFDLFLESFKIGDGTPRLLKHLMILALDEKAYRRCLQLHKHCFALLFKGHDMSREAYFMTPVYLEMMWRRIDFLRSILELGYNFVFTDADVMWFRDPFPRFYPDADFQIACDHYLGNSVDTRNILNGGFNFVRSNNRSIEFYKYWYSSRETYPGFHDQDVLNNIKFDSFVVALGLKMRFLNTAYFGGFCEPSRDMNLVCTMHANCCYGMDSKLQDLRVMLQDWKNFSSLPPESKRTSSPSWTVPRYCRFLIVHAFHEAAESISYRGPGETIGWWRLYVFCGNFLGFTWRIQIDENYTLIANLRL